MEILEYLESQAQKVIDSSLSPQQCSVEMNRLLGAVDLLIKCNILTDHKDRDKALDILEQVQTLAFDSLDYLSL